MNFSRRGSMQSAGVIVVAVLAVLALVLIILKFKDSKDGPGVSAVAVTGGPGGASTKPAARSNPDKAPTGAKKAPVQQFDRDMEIQVLDEASKQPLEGVELSINMQGAGQRKDRTETKGKAWLMLPQDDPKYVSISAKLPGYVGRQIDWRGEPLPATLTIEMEKGTSIGGIVKDEQGNPIKGAGVSLLFPGDKKSAGRGMYMTEGPFRTDAEGKWRCDVVPADLTNLSMKLDHPDFVSDESYGSTPRPADTDLRGMTATSVMKRGLSLAGIVTDLEGKPIAGASVLQGSDRFGTNHPKVKTDAEGKFAFRSSRPGPAVITVTAKTYAPDMRAVNVGPGTPPIEFKLAPGNVIKGKIVDRNGKPVSGAFVAADTWRGNRSLEWRVSTKADGTFVWKEAPSDEVLIDMGKQGFQSKRRFGVKPSDTEYVITLQPPQKIHGAVVDSESGQPIETFKVIQGLAWDNQGAAAKPQVSWQRDWGSVVGKDGQFQMTFDEPYPYRCLRVEALGYLPVVSPLYKPEDVDMTFDVKLVKGSGPTGIVKNADGTPAANVDVALATAAAGAGMRNGVLDARYGGQAAMVKTKEDGKFEFAPQTETFLLIAASPAGYAEVKQDQFNKNKEITLQPWGRVEGNLKIGSKPGAGQQVVLNMNRAYEQGAPQFWAQYEITTDKDGNFVFDRAPVGDAQVSRQVMNRTNAQYTSSTYTHTATTTVKSGETVKVQLGGVGRPLIGKLNIPKEAAGRNWQIQGGMSTKQPEAQTPKGFDEWTEEKQRDWWKQLSETPEWKERQRKSRHFNFQVEADGTFKMEDVTPGTYQLYFNAQETTQTWEQVAMGSGEITVAEIPGGFSDEPQDVGKFELRLLKKIQVGEPLSAIPDLADLDGKPIKLEDYKGKLLALHFWSSNHPQSTAEVPKLKEVYDAFAKDGRLVIVGFNFDRTAATGKSYVTKNDIAWPQVYAAKINVYQEFGLRNFPTSMLVGADGKLIARDLSAEQLKMEVEKAIKK